MKERYDNNHAPENPPKSEARRLKAVEKVISPGRFDSVPLIRRKVWGYGLTPNDNKVLDHRTLRFLEKLEEQGKAERRMKGDELQFRHTGERTG